MGKKYSINSAGFIVAERDVYSLGGFIPKGNIGGKVASEEQLSQDGECWLAGGDISSRPDIRIKDNAFIGNFYPGSNPVHTDGVTEFSGNTKIPGQISIRAFSADAKCDMIVRDSFIGIFMDCVCGPATNTKAFPFEQGRFNQDASKGTLFTSATMRVDAENFVRNTAVLRIGKDTRIYVPPGFNARIYWAYYTDSPSGFAYAGESETATSTLYKLSHPIYNTCMVAYARNPTLTPAELETSGARVIGHISGSLLMDLRPESVSGVYVMDGSEFIMPTDNFALATTQLRFLAGGLINTTMYTKTDRQDYKPYGTFRNVERLEYIQYLADIHRGNANRDHYIVASDSPLVRISESFVSGPLVNARGVTLRRCIVPKASFTHNKVLGNTYEDIDFSYAQEHIGKTVAGRTLYSSHMQGHYDMFSSGGELTGVINRPENLDDTARLTEAHVYTQLDGDIIEQGGYSTGSSGSYEIYKINDPNRVRMKTPLTTRGAVFPALPSNYRMKAILYLDDNFISKSYETDVTELKNEYPYFVASFRKEDDSAITAKEFISKGLFIQGSDYTKYPIISGSGYVGAGVTVRGDVQVTGQEYEKRYFDINKWEKGGINESLIPQGWEAGKNPPGGSTDADRRRFKEVIPVEPGAVISCNPGYWFNCYVYAFDGTYLGTSNWSQAWAITPSRASFMGVILKKSEAASGTGYIEDSDIPLAEARYVKAFKRLRYITNELDRRDPSDILLGPDYWEQGSMASGEENAGKTYEELKTVYTKAIRLKRPINVFMPGQSTGQGAGFNVSRQVFDALTKLYSPVSDAVYAKTALITLVIVKSDASEMSPNEAPDSRVYVEFKPSPRIVVPYGSATLNISRVKIRMYDNAVLSRNFNQEGSITLQGNAVMGYDFDSGACLCSNGHDDAIIKLP